ncbi:MAG: hypothetical protein ACFE9T_09715 [Promethearchaeota archaeon]
MSLYNLKRDPSWFFSYIENYYHLFLDIKFDKQVISNKKIKFSMELGLQGFEGLIFYIYKPHSRKIKFDLIKHSIDQTHYINNLNCNLTESPTNSLDLIIIPFGYYKDEYKMTLSVRIEKSEADFDLYAWSPSSLYKHVKSVIRIGNQYTELIPIADYKGYYFQTDSSFKGNETGRLFDLINLLVEIDNSEDEFTHESIVEPMDADIKALVKKSNEFLFELCQTSVPLEIKNIIRELERLKFNIDSLSKDEIFNWLDDLINFYSGRTK